MAKVTIEFDSIEEIDDMEWCFNGRKWWSVTFDLDQYLRGRLKYEDNLPEDAYKALDEARDKLYELLRENGLTFN